MEMICNKVCDCGHRRGIHALHGARCYAVLNPVNEQMCGCTEFTEHSERTPLREVFEPHDGFYVRVLHKDNGTRTWHRRGDRWHSDTAWFGWSWEQLMDDTKQAWLSTHVDTWEAI